MTYDCVVQTVANNQLVPDKVNVNWKTFAPNIKRVVMSDKECIEFLREEYNEDYVNKFNYFEEGAHKADLFRYAWLYKRGGVYMDIKTQLIKPFEDLFPNKDICYIVVTDPSMCGGRANRIYNGIIATPPFNILIFYMLMGTMQMTNAKPYLTNCEQGYAILKSYFQKNIRTGVNTTNRHHPDGFDVCVYTEVELKNRVPKNLCNKLDRYGHCTYVVKDNIPIIKIRYHDYPWVK